jgi:hypothetical protein
MIKVWLALLIAVVMLPGPGAAAKVRPGAAVVLTTRGGQEIRGELYAVKKDALTIAGPEGDLMTVGTADIVQVRVKIPAGQSTRTGAIVGGGVGLLLMGATIAADSHGGGGSPQPDELLAIAGLTAVSAGLGALVGWIAAGGSSSETFQLGSLSGEALDRALAKLRKRARVPTLA